jgi:hypothetical protein
MLPCAALFLLVAVFILQAFDGFLIPDTFRLHAAIVDFEASAFRRSLLMGCDAKLSTELLDGFGMHSAESGFRIPVGSLLFDRLLTDIAKS